MHQTEWFDFYGVTVLVQSSGERGRGVLANLVEEFGYFSSGPSASSINESDIQIVLREDLGADELYEQSYTTLVSQLFKALDKKGFHRVDALGILSPKGRAGVLVSPQRAATSALAALLLRDTDVGIFSDGMPLVHSGILYPFPTRIALRSNIAEALLQIAIVKPGLFKFPIPRSRVPSPCPISFVLLGSASRANEVKIVKASKLSSFVWSLKTRARVQAYRFDLSSDVFGNQAVLTQFLAEL